MSQPFKFRHQNEIVGAFVIGAVCTLLAVFVLIVRGQGWFEPRFACAAVFEGTGVGLLERGLAVRVRGSELGEVKASTLDREGRLVAELSLFQRYRHVVRRDSEVVLYTPMAGLPGEAFLEIRGGAGSPELEPGGQMRGRVAADLLQLATDVLSDVHKTLPATVRTVEQLAGKVDRLLGAVEKSGVLDSLDQAEAIEKLVARGDRLATKLEAVLDAAQGTLEVTQRTLDAAGGTLAKVDHGGGLISQAINDRRLYPEIVASVGQMQTTMARVNGLLAQADKAGKDLPQMARLGADALKDLAVVSRQLRKLAPMMPSMAGRIDDVLFEGKALMEAAQRHWLVGSYLQPEGTPTLLAPTGIYDKRPARAPADVERALGEGAVPAAGGHPDPAADAPAAQGRPR